MASVGLIPRYLPFIHENTGIRYLRHALALDERRVKFYPQFCVEPGKKRREEAEPVERTHHLRGLLRKIPDRATTLVKAYEDLVNTRQSIDQPDALEVWFAGVHTGLLPIQLLPELITHRFFRRGWRICPEWNPSQPRPYPPSVDDSGML